jgi:hypothetical protein
MASPREPVRLALRKLWSDHVFWTREYIMCAVRGQEATPTSDADAAAGRLLRNQDDIGNAIVPYYGEQAGRQLTDLLKQHIMIAVDLVAAAKAGDNDRFAKEDARWSANAEDIAGFLSAANPNWPLADVSDLLAQHLKLTKDEAVAFLQKDYGRAVEVFDDIYNEIIVLADALHDGLAAQFPERLQKAA